LVDVDSVVRKLPSLFVGNCSSRNKMGWRAFMRSRYRFKQFIKHNPEKFNTLVNRVIFDLSELEKAVWLNAVRQKETHQVLKVKYEKVSNSEIETEDLI
jgi:hypothetical protein